MATTVNPEVLRELAGFRAERGCAITVYLNLDPSASPTVADVQTRINSVLDEAGKSNGADPGRLSHDQREGLRADFERVRRYFVDEFDREGARGAAVFCAGLDGQWSPHSFLDTVADAVKVGRQFYLSPLVPLLDRGRVLIVQVSREHGHIYRVRGGRLEEIVDRFEEQSGQHQQRGRSQAHHERHVEHLIHEHLRRVADELDRQARGAGSPKIVIVSTEELRADFEAALSNETKNAVVGWTNAEAHVSPAELFEVVKPVLETAARQEERRAIERWQEEAGRKARASMGWGPTVEAASDGRVELLLFQEGAACAIWQCPKCGRLSAAEGSCPLDGSTLEEDAAGLDLAVHQTLAFGGDVLAVRDVSDLDPVEGIGALLRY